MAAPWPIKFTDEAKPCKVLKRKRAEFAVKDSEEKKEPVYFYLPGKRTDRGCCLTQIKE